MTGYLYNEKTLEYSGSLEIEVDKLSGRYNMPPNCTTKSPLKAKDGYAVVYNKEEKDWEYEADYRGTWYGEQNCEKKEVTSLYFTDVKTPVELRTKYVYESGLLTYGSEKQKFTKQNPADNEYGVHYELVEFDTEQEKYVLTSDMSKIKEKLYNWASERYYSAIEESISVNGYEFQANDESAQEASKVILSGLSPICWITADNDHVVITKDELQYFYSTCIGRNQRALVLYQSYREEVAKISSHEELDEFEPNWKEYSLFGSKSEDEKKAVENPPVLTNLEERFSELEKISLEFEREPIDISEVQYSINTSASES